MYRLSVAGKGSASQMTSARPDEKSWNMFFGGNTRRGFYCLFDSIVMAKARRLYILKGNPGSGKSTIIHRVGRALEQLGKPVEYYRCASDYESLDGLYSPSTGVALVDGTAPHQIDPQLAGVRDLVINLDECRCDTLLRNMPPEEFATLRRRIKAHFTSAYGYLEIAGTCQDITWSLMQQSSAVDFDRLKQKAADLAELISKLPAEKRLPQHLPRQRSGFLGAFTPQGPKSESQAVEDRAQRCWILQGGSELLHHALLSRIVDAVDLRGINYWAFFSPLDPDLLKHCFFPDRGAAIISAAGAGFNGSCSDQTESVTADSMGLEISGWLAGQIDPFNCTQRTAIQRATGQLASARSTHKELEKQYRCSMDFSCLDAVCEELICDITDFLTEK